MGLSWALRGLQTIVSRDRSVNNRQGWRILPYFGTKSLASEAPAHNHGLKVKMAAAMAP